MACFAVYGATGFVGRHLVRHLLRRGHVVEALGRNTLIHSAGDDIHAIYCVGITADFRRNPNGTAQAHVGVLAGLLAQHRFASLLYLSSTRVYSGAEAAREDAEFLVSPEVPDQLYNLTKLAGESLCLSSQTTPCRVARLSNVIGPGSVPTNFLPSLVVEARASGTVVLKTSAESTKDYVSIRDVVVALERIALSGRQRIYNVASGRNTSNAEVAAVLAKRLSARVVYAPEVATVTYPPIQIGRLVTEFGWAPMPFETAFELSLEPEERMEAQ